MDGMNAMDAPLAGVAMHPLRQIADRRGAVLHMLRADAPWFSGFGEVYFSEVALGAIKAWKRHLRMTQYFAVPVGRIRLVLWDDRPDSTTRGATQVIELGRPESYMLVIVPPRLWYGFTAIGSGPALLSNCANMAHDPAESERMELHEAADRIPYRWEA